MAGARETDSSIKHSCRSPAVTSSPPSAQLSPKKKRDRRGRIGEMGGTRETASSLRQSSRLAAVTSSPPSAHHDAQHKRDSRGGIGEMRGARETPFSQRSARSPAATSSPPFVHYPIKQKRDRRGRFARNTTKRPASRSRNVPAAEAAGMIPGIPDILPGFTAAEAAGMFLGIPDIPPGFTEAHRNVNRGKAAAQPCSSSIPEPKEPNHRYVFIVNPKVSIHCSFSHDSDDEMELWPIPLKREIKKEGESLRVLLKRKYFKEPISISDDDSDSSP